MSRSNNIPSDEDLEFLNKIDQGYIGLTKPKVEHHKEEPLTFPAWQLEIEDGDHLRIDEQGME